MKLLLITVFAVLGLATLNQVSCDSSSSLSSSEEQNIIKSLENDFLNFARKKRTSQITTRYPQHYPSGHYTTPYPSHYPAARYTTTSSPHYPPQYRPQYKPQYPPQYPPHSRINNNCQLCSMIVTYISHNGGTSVYSRNNALHSACSSVGTSNMYGCQQFVRTYGQQLLQYIHAHSNPNSTCRLLHLPC